MALTSIVALVKPPLGSIYRKRTKKRGEEKSNERSPLWKLNYSCYRRFEPMIRTGREKERGGDRKFQFIKLLSVRTSSCLRPSYLLFNHCHIFFTIAYRSLSFSLPFLSPFPFPPPPLPSSERAIPYACTHTLAFHLSVSSCFRRAVPIKREPYLGLAGTR